MSAKAVRRAREDGANVTAGAAIHNLALNDNDVGEYRTFFRLAPPLRAEEDRLATIEALRAANTMAGRVRGIGLTGQMHGAEG